MSFRVHKTSGTIHTNCGWYRKGKPENYIECSTLHEAEIKAKQLKLKPRLCSACNFKKELQQEIDA